jgi:hypothetical protein
MIAERIFKRENETDRRIDYTNLSFVIACCQSNEAHRAEMSLDCLRITLVPSHIAHPYP